MASLSEPIRLREGRCLRAEEYPLGHAERLNAALDRIAAEVDDEHTVEVTS